MLARAMSTQDQRQRALRIALWGSAALGLLLRVRMYAVHPPTLWLDEAYWAMKALNTAAIDAQIRPLGFMLLTQFLLRLFGAAAWVYRLLPFVGGLVSMGLAPFVASRLFRAPWSQVLCVLLLALSPIALEMSAEFKHYGGEIGVYVGVLSAFFYFRDKRSLARLALLVGVAWLSFFFSITVVFLYPALFGTLLWEAWRNKQRRQLFIAAGAAVVCLATITTIYFTTWHTISAKKAENKWGTWYDVFYIQNGLKVTHDSRLTWTAAKYFELAAVPGADRAIWQSERVSDEALERLRNADLVLWGALHVAGLALLARRRRFAELALLWSPLWMVTIFNLAGRWPAGAFRTNSFYLPFAIFIASSAGEWFLHLNGLKRWLGPSFAALLVLSIVCLRPSLTEKALWTHPGAFTEALRLLPPNPPRNQRKLVMDFESCRPWDYYTAYDRAFASVGAGLRKRYEKRCLRTGKQLAQELNRLRKSQPAGFTFLLTDSRKFEFMQEVVKKSCPKSNLQFVHGRTHLIIHCSDS
jgi:hypothetical protein